MENLNVLIVDDDAANREVTWAMLAPVLEELEITEVHQAPNGAEAMQILNKDQKAPWLLMLDWQMPVMSGKDVLQEIEKGNFPLISVIVQSGDTMAVSEALEAGADDFIEKPYNLADLHAHVRLRIGTLAKFQQLQQKNAELRDEIARLQTQIGELATATTDKRSTKPLP